MKFRRAFKDDAATYAGGSDVQIPDTEPSQGFSGASDSANAPDVSIEIHNFELNAPYLDITA